MKSEWSTKLTSKWEDAISSRKDPNDDVVNLIPSHSEHDYEAHVFIRKPVTTVSWRYVQDKWSHGSIREFAEAIVDNWPSDVISGIDAIFRRIGSS